MTRKKIITLGLDEKIIGKLDREKNKSKFVNDLLLAYYFRKKETDKNDLRIISDFIQELKNMNFKIDKSYKLLKINTEFTNIAAQTIKGVQDPSKIDRIIGETKKYRELLDEFKKTNN